MRKGGGSHELYDKGGGVTCRSKQGKGNLNVMKEREALTITFAE